MQTALTHHASPGFWDCYTKLPSEVQSLADENFAILKRNPRHPHYISNKSAVSGRPAQD
jgi:hypothetical protein